MPFDVMRRRRAYLVGDADSCAEWLRGFVDAGVRHIVLRFASLDARRHLERAGALAERLSS